MPTQNKNTLRKIWKTTRKTIGVDRRSAASESLKKRFSNPLKQNILSYASFNDELDTYALNQLLAFQGRLYLPKIVDHHLNVYRVPDLATCLQKGYGGILEPIPVKCSLINQVDLEAVLEVVLVPGLAFDEQNYRLGYGKGHYDRFLANFVTKQITIGIAFYEQQSITCLPVDYWDIPLARVFYF